MTRLKLFSVLYSRKAHDATLANGGLKRWRCMRDAGKDQPDRSRGGQVLTQTVISVQQ
jgi:hypothetical protein